MYFTECLRIKPGTRMNTTISVICYESKTLADREHPWKSPIYLID